MMKLAWLVRDTYEDEQPGEWKLTHEEPDRYYGSREVKRIVYAEVTEGEPE
jgi:hypothetical protein